MKKKITLFLSLCFFLSSAAVAQYAQNANSQRQQQIWGYENMFKQFDKEFTHYYANADTAAYGVRYLWSYLFDKEHKKVYQENRIVIVAKESMVDRSYQPIGERIWTRKHYKDAQMGRDSSMTKNLTPSFYFYYPKEKRQKKVYRMVTTEFLLKDTVINNQWEITQEEKNIGGFRCQKAICQQGGRTWYAWFTRDLPYEGAPRHLVGLPGVVLEAMDADGEIYWIYQGIVKNDVCGPLFVKYPDQLSTLPAERFPLILRLFAMSELNYVQRSGVAGAQPKLLPDICLPANGLDAYRISNPIER